ncbi:unnamed protein product [Penicillium roqueforti FM164]|uniref:Genomic scaffold, ProqFM164S01 n=1 Tax=Penicillium roqueforti (strain FM164) TaxID=1365484 RepID=W6Q571_PENRF|nr:unnamed protein product [Penicillium roqueforti FM164]
MSLDDILLECRTIPTVYSLVLPGSSSSGSNSFPSSVSHIRCGPVGISATPWRTLS